MRIDLDVAVQCVRAKRQKPTAEWVAIAKDIGCSDGSVRRVINREHRHSEEAYRIVDAENGQQQLPLDAVRAPVKSAKNADMLERLARVPSVRDAIVEALLTGAI